MLAFMVNMDYDLIRGPDGNPMSAAAWGSLLFRSIRSHKQPAGRSSTTTISSFAYQVGAGIGYEFPLSEGRSVTVSLDWRYFGTQAPTFTGAVTGNGVRDRNQRT